MASEVHPPLKELRTTEFPPDILLFHILPSLPGTSVIRFKCVSKQWQLFLSTPMFKKMHFDRVTNNPEQNHVKIIILSRTKREFCTLDCEAPEIGLTALRPLPFDVASQGLKILSSFHGLLCVGITNNGYEYSDILLWNPVTTEYKILSKKNSQWGCYRIYGSRAFELYYSSYDDDYKLLRVTFDYGVYIYSLKSDSWRKVGFLKDFTYGSEDWILSTWLNEKLYILKHFKDSSLQTYYSILRFDLKTEKFIEIASPSFEQRKALSFTVLKGCIHFWVNGGHMKVNSMDWRCDIELWSMGEDEKWTKVVTYCWLPSLTWFPQPQHIMKNGNWLMHLDTRTKRNHFYILDMVKNKDRISCSYNAETMVLCPKGKYMESFVSLNQYIK